MDLVQLDPEATSPHDYLAKAINKSKVIPISTLVKELYVEPVNDKDGTPMYQEGLFDNPADKQFIDKVQDYREMIYPKDVNQAAARTLTHIGYLSTGDLTILHQKLTSYIKKIYHINKLVGIQSLVDIDGLVKRLLGMQLLTLEVIKDDVTEIDYDDKPQYAVLIMLNPHYLLSVSDMKELIQSAVNNPKSNPFTPEVVSKLKYDNVRLSNISLDNFYNYRPAVAKLYHDRIVYNDYLTQWVTGTGMKSTELENELINLLKGVA